MLPRALYESLPYLYLITGLAAGLLIDSTLIRIASMLLFAAGLLILVLRYRFRNQAQLEERLAAVTGRRDGTDRRQQPANGFPLIDFAGNLVISDRRQAGRRQMDHGLG